MLVFEDHVSKGQWFSCQHCLQSGDIVQLVARHWELSEESAIVKLSKMGFSIDPAESNLQRYHAVTSRCNRFAEFWQQVRQNLIHGSTSAISLVHDLKLACGVSQDRWNRGLGQLLGGVSHKEAEQAYHPHSENQTRNSSEHRLFRGGKWGDVLVFPYWQLPGKLSGFLFVGREGDPEKDFVFRAIHHNGSSASSSFGNEAGLLLHPQVPQVAVSYGNHVVAIDDPVLSIRMQARNFEASGWPLPLVCCHAEDNRRERAQTLHGWKQFMGIRPVIWMPRYDRTLVEQAIVAGARISLMRPEDTSDAGLWRYITNYPPQELLRRIIRHSKPWPQAMTQLVQELDDGAIEDLFYYLEMDKLEPARVLERCDPKVRKHFRTLSASRPVRRVVPLSPTVLVAEIDDSWFLEARQGHSPLVSDAIIRIRDTIHQKTTGYTYYRGEILHQGKAFEFCESKEALKKDTWNWLEDFLDARGHVLRGNSRHSKDLIDIAIQLHCPEHSYGVDSVGWDLRNSRLLLPNYYLTAGGDVHSYDAQIPTPDTPGRNLLRPCDLSPAELDATAEDPDMAGPLWACFIAAMANIVAPAYRQPTSGIGLVGAGAELAGQGIADAMGCTNYQFSGRYGKDQATEAERRHGWPIFVQLPTASIHKKAMNEWLNIGGTHRHNCLVSLPWFVSRAKILFGGWHIVRADQPIIFSETTVDAFSKLTSAYLADLAKRHFKLSHWGSGRNPPWLISVAKDIRQFVEPQLPGWLDTVSPKQWIAHETRKVTADPLGSMLGHLASEGKLLVGSARSDVRRPSLLPLDEGMLLDKLDLLKLLDKEKVTLINPARITSALANSGALVGVHDRGWILQPAWWDKQLAKFTAREQHRLKIVR